MLCVSTKKVIGNGITKWAHPNQFTRYLLVPQVNRSTKHQLLISPHFFVALFSSKLNCSQEILTKSSFVHSNYVCKKSYNCSIYFILCLTLCNTCIFKTPLPIFSVYDIVIKYIKTFCTSFYEDISITSNTVTLRFQKIQF